VNRRLTKYVHIADGDRLEIASEWIVLGWIGSTRLGSSVHCHCLLGAAALALQLTMLQMQF